MNRLLLCLTLVAVLVSVHALSLHAHLTSGEAGSNDAQLIHVHSHSGHPGHHGEAEPGIDGETIDLLAAVAARDSGASHIDLAIALFVTLLLVVTWHRCRQRPCIEPPIYRLRSSHRRPSPRAPPLSASLF